MRRRSAPECIISVRMCCWREKGGRGRRGRTWHIMVMWCMRGENSFYCSAAAAAMTWLGTREELIRLFTAKKAFSSPPRTPQGKKTNTGAELITPRQTCHNILLELFAQMQ